MVAAILGVLLVLQQLQVTANVDRKTVALGEEVILSIVVHAGAESPVEILNPDLVGLEIRRSRDRSRLTVEEGAPAKVTTRELTLRVTRSGSALIGPVRVRYAAETVETAPIAISVSSPVAGASPGLATRVRALVQRARPPQVTGEDVGITIVTSADSVLLGDQVDLVTVAWFPRDVRSRLRNPPTLEGPAVRGAWAYHRPVPAGVALSRRIAGEWYDLYVQHEVVFPLTVGEVAVGSGSVSYSLPLSLSFLSREQRHVVRSESQVVRVGRLPVADRAGGFGGAAGRDLSFRVDVADTELPIGGAVRVRAEVQGTGNIAMWPEPEIVWPGGLRAYAEEIEGSVTYEGGLIGGTKAFNYLVVADSLGTHRVPPPAYRYFDVGTSALIELRAAPIEFVTASGSSLLSTLQTAPPDLMQPLRFPPVDALLATVPWLVWLLVAAAPPMVALLIRGLQTRRHRPRAAPHRRRPAGGTLYDLEREFRAILERLVPHASLRDGDGLADALRAAGIEAPFAAQTARVRDRLRQALFGPSGATDLEELTAEVQEVLRALVGEYRKAARSGFVGVALVALCVGAAAQLAGQTPERLYETGAVRDAADSFLTRVATAPTEAANWYNLGTALSQLGDGAGARAAWLRAARLAPRNPTIRRALTSSPPPDPATDALTWIAPVTPGEALLVGAVAWILTWVLVATRTRTRFIAIAATVAVVVVAYGAYVSDWYATPVALVQAQDTPLRPAPYGTASTGRFLSQGTAVVIEAEVGAWVRIARASERGWLLRTEVVPL